MTKFSEDGFGKAESLKVSLTTNERKCDDRQYELR